ncbi:MAG: DUF6608 family protein [Bacteroidales bacterium]|nr:DUF6608 family protein [Bacteroidales bacterium]
MRNEKNWDNWLKESVYIYCTIYTITTILNSVLYLIQGYRDDPSGNWHELTRAVIVLIGVTAYEMATKIPIKNILLRSLVVYVPTLGLVFGFVWLNQFIEPLAKSAYRDMFINYTSLFVIVSIVAIIRNSIKRKKGEDK